MEGFYEQIKYISQEAKENIQKIEIEKKTLKKKENTSKMQNLWSGGYSENLFG